MDHPFSTPSRTAFHPWRAAALVAIAVAAAELIALMIAGVALLNRSLGDDTAAAARPAKHSAVVTKAPAKHPVARPGPTKPTLTRQQTSVLVLNGNGVAGAAGAASTRVRALHYMLGGVGNAEHRTAGPSVIMYRPGYRAEGLRLGRDLHVAAVGSLDGLRAEDLMGAHLAFIVGSD